MYFLERGFETKTVREKNYHQKVMREKKKQNFGNTVGTTTKEGLCEITI